MKFKLVFESLQDILFESRYTDIIDKYGMKLDKSIIERLSKSDPSGNNAFLKWMVERTIEGASPEEVISVTQEFNKRKQAPQILYKDIYQYKDLKTLKDQIEDAIRQSKSAQLKKAEESKDETKIYEDSKFIIFYPRTYAESKVLCQGANWCISQNDNEWWNKYRYQENKNKSFIFMRIKEYNIKDKYSMLAFCRFHNLKTHKVEKISVFDYYDDKHTFKNIISKFNLSDKIQNIIINYNVNTESYISSFFMDYPKTKFAIDKKFVNGKIKYGLVTKNGSQVVPYIYDYITIIDEGEFFAVYKNCYWPDKIYRDRFISKGEGALLDKNLNLILKLKPYELIKNTTGNKIFIIYKTDLHNPDLISNVYDINTKELIKPKEKIKFIEKIFDYYVVSPIDSDVQYLVDKNLKRVTKDRYQEFEEIANTFIRAERNYDDNDLLTKDLKILYKGLQEISEPYSDENQNYIKIAKPDYKYGLIDKTGKIVVPFIYNDVKTFKDSDTALLKKKKNEICAIINLKTKQEIIPFSKGYYINNDGIMMKESGIDDLYGLVDLKTGKIIVEPIYNYIYKLESIQNLFVVGITKENEDGDYKRKYALFYNNKQLTPFIYNNIRITSTGIIFNYDKKIKKPELSGILNNDQIKEFIKRKIK